MWGKLTGALEGKKTFIVCICGVLYAGYGWYRGFLTQEQAFQILQVSGVGAGLRAAK